MNSLHQIAKAIGVLLLATTAVVALATVLVLAVDFVLLIFLGVLLSVFLTKTSEFANRFIPIGYSLHLAMVTTLLILVLIGGFILFGNKIHDRLQETSKKLDEGTQQVEELLREYPLAMNAVKRIPFAEKLLMDNEEERGTSGESRTGVDGSGAAAGKVFAVLEQILTTSLGLIANIGVICFVGIFMAVDPTLYRDGFARLFPVERRTRVKEVLDKISDTLFSWLMGRFMTMLITGGGTAAALYALQVPMAITVGVITGVLTFVPNIGGVIALVLATLLALPQGLSTVGWVIGLYLALQLLESNVITPLLQQHQTSIPPALLISFQVIMGAVTGFLGLMVATPLLAASLVLIQEVWIQDVLGESQVEA